MVSTIVFFQPGKPAERLKFSRVVCSKANFSRVVWLEGKFQQSRFQPGKKTKKHYGLNHILPKSASACSVAKI